MANFSDPVLETAKADLKPHRETALEIGPQMVLELIRRFQGQPLTSRKVLCFHAWIRIIASWLNYLIMQVIQC
jgi:hypothetical protein